MHSFFGVHLITFPAAGGPSRGFDLIGSRTAGPKSKLQVGCRIVPSMGMPYFGVLSKLGKDTRFLLDTWLLTYS